MKKCFVFFVVFSLLLSSTGLWAEEPVVTAPSVILIDAKTGKALFEKNADAQKYPASTTKVMTGLLAVEYGNFDQVVTIADDVPGQIERGSSQMSLIPGEELQMEQLLYGMMLVSANDAAVAIAEQISGSVDKFAEKMNEKAKEIGATHTHFTNPNGLHNDNHYTTARDLAAIARYAMTLPKFREVVGTVRHDIPKTNKQELRNYITNGNKLIWKNFGDYRYEYATGIKTGYTTKSKHCLVAGAKKGDMELIAVIMESEGSIYADAISLFEYGFSNFQNTSLLQKDQIVTTVTVKDSEEKLNLLAAESFSLALAAGEKDLVKSVVKTNPDIQKPIKKGDKLGSIIYTLNDKEIKKVDLLSSQELLPPVKADKVSPVKWIGIVILIFLIYRTVITLYKIQRRNRRRSMSYIKR